MSGKGLLVASDGQGYVFGVTDAKFWALVGSELAKMRLRAGFDRTYSAYRAGAPATATLNDIEEGRIGNVDSLSAYCAMLNVSVLDVFRSVLAEDDEHPLSADARFVAQMFQDGPNEDLREAILAGGRARDDPARPTVIGSRL